MTAAVRDIFTTLKSEGLKATFKKHGWKAAALIVSYYLVRDVTLYILIPAFIAFY